MEYLEASYIEAHLGQVVGIPQPAVASGFTYTYSINEYWKPRSLCFQLVTDANVANRLVFADIIDGGGLRLGRFSAGFNQTATLTTIYTFSPDISVYGANGAVSIGCAFPAFWLHPGAKITVGITNVQAGDQISNIALAVDQVFAGSYAS